MVALHSPVRQGRPKVVACITPQEVPAGRIALLPSVVAERPTAGPTRTSSSLVYSALMVACSPEWAERLFP